MTSIVSSTGLDRQNSLLIANQSILRHLESTVLIDAQNRIRTSRDEREERRHDELINSIQNKATLEDQICQAKENLRTAAFAVFPGSHLLICIVTSLLSRLSSDFAALCTSHGNSYSGIILTLAKKACGCSENITTDEVFTFHQGFSALQSVSNFQLLSLTQNIIWNSGPMNALSSAACLTLCTFKMALFFSAIFILHRLLQLLHCHHLGHDCLNLAASVYIIMPLVANTSPLLTTFAPVIIINSLLMGSSLMYLHHHHKKSSIQSNYLTSLEKKKQVDRFSFHAQIFQFLLYTFSLCAASIVGFYL